MHLRIQWRHEHKNLSRRTRHRIVVGLHDITTNAEHYAEHYGKGVLVYAK